MASTEKRDGIEPAVAETVGKPEDGDQPMSTVQILQNAKLATDKEHKMTLLQGIKLYPKAVAWSMLISTCIVMEGYDISLVGNFYAFPQFNRKYGEKLGDGSYQVPARVRQFCCF